MLGGRGNGDGGRLFCFKHVSAKQKALLVPTCLPACPPTSFSHRAHMKREAELGEHSPPLPPTAFLIGEGERGKSRPQAAAGETYSG